jgi:probable F420-dependent oxidoreductase
LIVDGEPGRTLADFAVTARELETQGFSSLWVGEHVVTFPSYRPNCPYSPDGHPPFLPRQGWYDPLFALAAAASTTTTLRLGTSILILPQRNPVVVAQEVVALDHPSRGRVRLGVGLGWSQEEYEACGVPWTRRGARFDEYIDAMTHLWQDELVTFEGEFVSSRDAVSLPKIFSSRGPPSSSAAKAVPPTGEPPSVGTAGTDGPCPKKTCSPPSTASTPLVKLRAAMRAT